MVRPIPLPPFARFGLVLAVILAADVRVDAAQLIERAQAYHSQGNLEAAIGDLRGVLRDEPGNEGARAMLVGAYIDKAAVLRRAKRLDQSVSELENALHFDRENATARALLAEHYMDLAAEAVRGRDRIALLKRAVQTVPAHAGARLRLGEAFINVGALANGEKELRHARENGLAAELIVEPLADALMRQQKYADLLVTFVPDDEALRPVKPLVLVLRAQALVELDRVSEAELALAKALEIDSGNARAVVGLGRAALRRGDIAAASAALQRATTIAPADADVLRLRGDLSYRRGDYAAAVDAYGEVLEARFDPLVRMNQALSQIATGGSVAVVADVERVLAEAPRHTGANYLRALAAFDQGDYEAARSHIATVQTVKPDHLPSEGGFVL